MVYDDDDDDDNDDIDDDDDNNDNEDNDDDDDNDDDEVTLFSDSRSAVGILKATVWSPAFSECAGSSSAKHQYLSSEQDTAG